MTPRLRHRMRARRWLCIALGPLLVVLMANAQTLPPAPDGAIPQTVQFNRDIRPILSDKCYTCHGPSKQMAGLRFDREEVAKQVLRDNRVAVVPGEPEHSEMLRRSEER